MTKRGLLCAALLILACRTPVSVGAQPAVLKQEIESLHRAMVAAFRQDPATVARFYTDDASIMGGGSRSVGRDEVDRYWSTLTDGGKSLQCGWVTDRYGVTWQIVPDRLTELINDPDPGRANRAMQAMLQMDKIEIKTLEDAANASD